MTRVKLDVLKPWITQRITQLLGIEDDVVIEFVFNQLEERVTHLSAGMARRVVMLLLHTFSGELLAFSCTPVDVG